MERTSDLVELQFAKRNFTWGKVREIHTLGRYNFVEYHPWKTSGASILVGKVDYERISYHIYIDGKNTSMGADGLEAAMVTAIAYAFDGPNSQGSYRKWAAFRREQEGGEGLDGISGPVPGGIIFMRMVNLVQPATA